MNGAAVEADGLRKRFGDVLALDGLSFAAQAGSVLGLLGPNGSGKTTTVSILSTSLRPDGGRAVVEGLDVVADAARRGCSPRSPSWSCSRTRSPRLPASRPGLHQQERPPGTYFRDPDGHLMEILTPVQGES